MTEGLTFEKQIVAFIVDRSQHSIEYPVVLSATIVGRNVRYASPSNRLEMLFFSFLFFAFPMTGLLRYHRMDFGYMVN